MPPATADPGEDVAGKTIDVRCVCSARLRIRNARAGLVGQCPQCGYPLTLTQADLTADYDPDGTIRLQEPPGAGRLPAAPLPVSPPVSAPPRPTGGEGPRPPRLDPPGAVITTKADGRVVAEVPSPIEYVDRSPQGPPIEEPSRSFGADLLYAAYMSVQLENAVTLVMAVLIALVADGLVGMFHWASQEAHVAVGALFLVVLPLPVLVLGGCVLSVAARTAVVADDLPDFGQKYDLHENFLRPLKNFALAGLYTQWPAILVGILMFKGVVPTSLTALLVLTAPGMFIWPMVILTLSVTDNVIFLDPWTVLMHIKRLLGPYLLSSAMLWVATALFCFVIWLPLGQWFDAARTTDGKLLRAGAVVALYFVAIASLMAGMRGVGLLFRHYRDRFTWEIE